MNPKKIDLSLTIAEVNQILDALGALPYAQVYELVGTIQQQAQSQLGLASVPEERHG
ncbi:hypothetical protein GCM10009677_54720 [Sphaerisporangium rubeum]|uniref:Uncharacterized protein n=1 Tax=Sphaerisporangium rubeum TaxID=321317 RepID=A0A7X0I903_9ACTN|nr:hypothetical protein [Sphaerisporangium rubeum]MBB6470842.1 hypothetical protein [Sphaerisporangium rubeum]